jgi:LmbE family N-acetylglucosaminyl deacetylase
MLRFAQHDTAMLKLSQPAADLFIPDGSPAAAALARTTHLCIAAHQDDIEIMAHSAIAECHGRTDAAFTGVVVTDGGGSPRSGEFAALSDEEMKRVRRDEQRRAAELGRYAAQIQLAHPSRTVKDPAATAVVDDLKVLLAAMTPHTVYLHNPADKHDTHIAVLHRCLAALRALPAERRPARVLGCEVWRNLDWLLDTDKVALDDSAQPELAAQLIGAFRSQIAGGKRYDLAIAGRRLANATFHTSHATDRAAALTWAMDLTPLFRDPQLDLAQFTLAHIDRFRDDVAERLHRFT